MITAWWAGLGSAAKTVVGVLAAALVLACAGATAWLWRAEQQVLFSGLDPQDTASMAAELDRLKVPYAIAPDGNTILVDARVVHATRLKLMSRELPLRGGAGFELFNTAEFGMTEFAQKINYQRALQGEIARTILSLAEVKDARVHLTLPEEGLFKRGTSKPKAAITVGLRPGEGLRPEQVAGIQRLVAAAAPGIAAADVTILDQQGVALTPAGGGEGGQESVPGRLELKRETERLLSRKATRVLERAFGPGQALASVDVTLQMDQVRVTTEDVLGAPLPAGMPAAGVVTRERESVRDGGPPLNERQDAPARGGTTQREVEYQVGRRVEQVATQPGAIRRLQVVAVVRQALDEPQIEQMKRLVGAAVGASSERGDTVVVQSLHAFQPPRLDDEAPRAPARAAQATPPMEASGAARPRWLPGALAAALVGAAVAGAWMVRTRATGGPLRPAQREALLETIHAWLAADPGSGAPGSSGDARGGRT